jgi:hypothetical protein
MGSYDYNLSRIQRLMSVVAEWWIWMILIVCWCLAIPGAFDKSPVFVILTSVLMIVFFRGLIFGIVGVIRQGAMHVEIREGGLGFGTRNADWWLFTDGIRQIRRNFWGTTTVSHHNGTYIDIPTSLLSEGDLSILRTGLQKYRDAARIRTGTKNA